MKNNREAELEKITLAANREHNLRLDAIVKRGLTGHKLENETARSYSKRAWYIKNSMAAWDAARQEENKCIT